MEYLPIRSWKINIEPTLNQSTWTINQTNNTNNNGPSNNTNNRNISIVVPNIHGLGEKFKKICKNKGIQAHSKGTNTVKTLLMVPKDKDPILQKSGTIYKFKCPHINCPEEYIGKSGRTLGGRVKEHLRAPPPIPQHSNTTGHPFSTDCFTIVHRTPHGNTRNIRRPCSSGLLTLH